MDKKGYIDTDGFKFYDYFSSVDIPFYNGILNFDSYLKDNDWRGLFMHYENICYLIKVSVQCRKIY